jgi:hypothetical protein
VASTEDYLNFQIPSNLTGGGYSIRVSGLEGAITGSNLYVLENPYVSGFYPLSGGVGQTLTLTGLNIYPSLTQIFIDSTGISANINTGSWDYNNNTISFTIPNISSGLHNIIVYNSVSSGSGSFLFKFIPSPQPTGFVPSSGAWGDFISLSGFYFDVVTSLSVSNINITNYSIVGATGITFQIPTGTSTDYIIISNSGGYNFTQNQLIIVPPIPIFSGFIAQETYFGSGVIISGRYLSTISEIQFTGGTGYISISNFSGINDTGINFILPGGISGGYFRLAGPRGYSYSPYTLNLINIPIIGLKNIQTGVSKIVFSFLVVD